MRGIACALVCDRLTSGTPRSKIGGLTAQILKTAKSVHRTLFFEAPNSKTHKTPKTHGKRAAPQPSKPRAAPRNAILVLQPQPAGATQMAKCGSGHLTATLYSPGYVAPRLDMKKVAVMTALREQPMPFVIYLCGMHLSPLCCRARSVTPLPSRHVSS